MRWAVTTTSGKDAPAGFEGDGAPLWAWTAGVMQMEQAAASDGKSALAKQV
jgi:hypothetical protein